MQQKGRLGVSALHGMVVVHGEIGEDTAFIPHIVLGAQCASDWTHVRVFALTIAELIMNKIKAIRTISLFTIILYCSSDF